MKVLNKSFDIVNVDYFRNEIPTNLIFKEKSQ